MTPFQYLKQTEKKRREDLFLFLRFPSVSAKSEHKKDMTACAGWLAKHLAAIGFKSKAYPTGGHPIVCAEYFVDRAAPTVLYYGHYDVQPPEPLELWKSPPFDPEIRAGYIYARGLDYSFSGSISTRHMLPFSQPDLISVGFPRP